MYTVQPACELISRRRFVFMGILVVASAIAIYFTISTPTKYEVSSQVLVVAENAGRAPSVSFVDLPALTTSTIVLQRVIHHLHLSIPLTEVKRNIQTNVSAPSHIMEIRYRDCDADRAVLIVNAIADELKRQYEYISAAQSDASLERLDRSGAEVEKRIKKIAGQIAKASAKYPLAEADHPFEALSNRLADLETQRQITAAAFDTDVTSLSDLEHASVSTRNAANNDLLHGDVTYQALSRAKAQDLVRLDAEKRRYAANDPHVLNVISDVMADRTALQAEATRVVDLKANVSRVGLASIADRRKAEEAVKADRFKLHALDGLIAAAHREDVLLPTASSASRQLHIELDAARSEYLTLATRRTEMLANRAEALSLGSILVFDRAVRAGAVLVGMGRLMLLCTLLCLVLVAASVAAYVTEFLDSSLSRPQQIADFYKTTYIATLG